MTGAGVGRALAIAVGRIYIGYPSLEGSKMRVKVAKWGNSIAVRLPKEVVERFRLKPGSLIDIDADEHGFHAAPATSRIPGVPSFAEMIAEMKRLGPENEPQTVEWGPDVGSEIIDDDYSRGVVPPEPPKRRRRRDP